MSEIQSNEIETPAEEGSAGGVDVPMETEGQSDAVDVMANETEEGNEVTTEVPTGDAADASGDDAEDPGATASSEKELSEAANGDKDSTMIAEPEPEVADVNMTEQGENAPDPAENGLSEDKGTSGESEVQQAPDRSTEHEAEATVPPVAEEEIAEPPVVKEEASAAAEPVAAKAPHTEKLSWRDTKSLSISAGNSHIQWAFHAAPKEGYAPILFWRTPHLPDRDGGQNKDKELANEYLEITQDPARATETLTRHLPDNVQAYIFGESEDAGTMAENLPTVKIYILSTSPLQLEALQNVWSIANCDCELNMMDGEQFFSMEDGAYKTMGTDRLASLKGAIDLYGLPALVIDGGTAMTYTAADETGRVMGGGISPGLKIRLESLHNSTGALPYIHPEEAYYRVMGEILGSKDNPVNAELLAKGPPSLPLNLFACSTEEAMIVSSFGDVGTWLRRCIGGWLHVVGTGKSKAGRKKRSQDAMEVLTTGKKTNNDRHVVFTGGDAELLMRMTGKSGEVIRVGSSNRKVINKGAGKLDNCVVSADIEILEQCQLVSRNNLVHYGICRVLKDEYYKKFAKSDKNASNLGGLDIENLHAMIGTRIAKKFAAVNTDGTHYFRGVVNEIYPDDGGDLLFGVTYDDGDREHLNLEELHEAIKLILEVGELGQKGAGQASSPKKRRVSEPEGASGKKKRKSSGEKTDSKSGPEKLEFPSHPKNCVGLRVAKYFDKDLYFGSVDAANEDNEAEEGWLLHITYDDGDQEDMELAEVKESRKLYSRKKAKDPNPDYMPPHQ